MAKMSDSYDSYTLRLSCTGMVVLINNTVEDSLVNIMDPYSTKMFVMPTKDVTLTLTDYKKKHPHDFSFNITYGAGTRARTFSHCECSLDTYYQMKETLQQWYREWSTALP